MTTRSLPSTPRPVALAVHSLLLASSLTLSGSVLAKNVTWDDIANDHTSTHNVLQYGNGHQCPTLGARWPRSTQTTYSN